MSENNEVANEFEAGAEDTNAQAPDEKVDLDSPTIAEAVKAALNEANVTQRKLSPCPCGTTNVNIVLEIPQNSKVGRATCGACGVWGVDFLAPRTQDQEVVGQAAAKAWNEAPRIEATDPA